MSNFVRFVYIWLPAVKYLDDEEFEGDDEGLSQQIRTLNDGDASVISSV